MTAYMYSTPIYSQTTQSVLDFYVAQGSAASFPGYMTIGFMIKNSDTSATVQYDGMQAFFDVAITYADYTNSLLTSDYSTGSCTSTNICDLFPTDISTIGYDTSAYDVTAVTSGKTLGTDMGCTEQWVLTSGNGASSYLTQCVKWQATMERDLSTGDTTQDFVWSMSSAYNVKAFAGQRLTGASPGTALDPTYYDQVSVNFANLATATTTGAMALVTGGVATTLALMATLF